MIGVEIRIKTLISLFFLLYLPFVDVVGIVVATCLHVVYILCLVVYMLVPSRSPLFIYNDFV